jgi:hypothetical protein
MTMHIRATGATALERQAVSRLRRDSFAQARQFHWQDPSALDWGPEDDRACVIGLWNEAGELVSTVRATVLRSALAAQSIIEYPIEHLRLPGPLMLLSRAATSPAHQRCGGNALVRCAYLAAAARAPVRCVITQVYDQAPRLHTMRQVGFTLTPLEGGWDSEARAITQPLLAWMLRPQFEPGAGLAWTAWATRAASATAADAAFELDAIVASLQRQCAALDVAATSCAATSL